MGGGEFNVGGSGYSMQKMMLVGLCNSAGANGKWAVGGGWVVLNVDGSGYSMQKWC
jgi:hypothetical protein